MLVLSIFRLSTFVAGENKIQITRIFTAHISRLINRPVHTARYYTVVFVCVRLCVYILLDDEKNCGKRCTKTYETTKINKSNCIRASHDPFTANVRRKRKGKKKTIL